MCIPYGAISALAGVAFYFLNAANLAAAAFIGGATALAASVFSLQEWKAGGDSKVYTLTSLGRSENNARPRVVISCCPHRL